MTVVGIPHIVRKTCRSWGTKVVPAGGAWVRLAAHEHARPSRTTPITVRRRQHHPGGERAHQGVVLTAGQRPGLAACSRGRLLCAGHLAAAASPVSPIGTPASAPGSSVDGHAARVSMWPRSAGGPSLYVDHGGGTRRRRVRAGAEGVQAQDARRRWATSWPGPRAGLWAGLWAGPRLPRLALAGLWAGLRAGLRAGLWRRSLRGLRASIGRSRPAGLQQGQACGRPAQRTSRRQHITRPGARAGHRLPALQVTQASDGEQHAAEPGRVPPGHRRPGPGRLGGEPSGQFQRPGRRADRAGQRTRRAARSRRPPWPRRRPGCGPQRGARCPLARPSPGGSAVPPAGSRWSRRPGRPGRRARRRRPQSRRSCQGRPHPGCHLRDRPNSPSSAMLRSPASMTASRRRARIRAIRQFRRSRSVRGLGPKVPWLLRAIFHRRLLCPWRTSWFRPTSWSRRRSARPPRSPRRSARFPA